MNRFRQYIERYRKVHTGEESITYINQGRTITPSKPVLYGDGRQFVKKVIPYIDYMIRAKGRAVSILDYGCGQARHVYDPVYATKTWRLPNFKNQTIFSFFPGMIQTYYCYDPCVPRYALLPATGSQFDFAAVPDVMEHIPEEAVDHVIKEVRSFVREDGMIVWTICGNPAIAHFSNSDGTVENLHVTVKPFSWWRDRLLSLSGDRAFALIYDSDEIAQATNGASDTRVFLHSSPQFQAQHPRNCRTVFRVAAAAKPDTPAQQ